MRNYRIDQIFTATLTFSLAVVLAAFPRVAAAQGNHPIDIGANYSYIRSNILPDCGCIALNGGGGLVQLGLFRHVAAMADVNVVHASNITPDGYALTQAAYTFGARYLPADPHYIVQPFIEALVGGVHASGTLAPTSTGFGSGSNVFALQAGGGVWVQLSDHLFLEPIRTDYLMTQFPNGSKGKQHDFRVSVGVEFRIKK